MSDEVELKTSPQIELFERWKTQVQEIGGTDPLKHFVTDANLQIDLTKSHPGGLAQFLGSGKANLTNLVRDPLALAKAISVARAIEDKTNYLEANYGLATCYIAAGLVSLENGGFDLSLPILLWPVSLVAVQDDYQLVRVANPFVNPELLATFDQLFDVRIDQKKVLSKLEKQTDLMPMPVLDYLSDLGSSVSQLEIKRVLAVANFVPELSALRKASETTQRGCLTDFGAVKSQDAGSNAVSPASAKPVFDLDQNQLDLISRALNGENLAIETLPGCGYTQTVAALLANFAASNKRVLLLANRQQTIDEVHQRLCEAGLGGLIARNYKTWLDVVSGISRNEKAVASQLDSVTESLQPIKTRLEDYFVQLESVGESGVSILEAMQKLAALAAMPHAPTSVARIAAQQLPRREDISNQLELLFAASDLGIFEFGPGVSSWYKADFSDQAELENVQAVANRLASDTFPLLSAKLSDFIDYTQFTPATSVSAWGKYLKLFVGLRETLDRFNPEVLDRPLDDLITATSSRKIKGELSGKTRRRLKKLAKEFQRPGIQVSDINAALVAAKQQRQMWNEFSQSLKPPMVPTGINDALVTYQALLNDLELIQKHLPEAPNLIELPLVELESKLKSLRDQTQPLENYFEKKAKVDQLAELGLASVVDNFASIGIKRDRIAIEFDQIWFQSALEARLIQLGDFLGLDNDRLRSSEAQFSNLDSSIVKTNQVELANQLSRNWANALRENPKQVELFRTALKSGATNLGELSSVAPDLLSAVCPVIAAPALKVSTDIPQHMKFDLVLILDASGSTIAENYAGLQLAKQVVAFGDPAISIAAGFNIEPVENESQPAISAFNEIREHFGYGQLRVNYRQHGQILADFINREFYQNRMIIEPTANNYFGRSQLKVNVIAKENCAPNSEPGSNESLDSEVLKTVELIFNHVIWHPEDSLLVATCSAKHVGRIRASIDKGLKTRPDLKTWFDAHGREKFEVSTISNLRHRSADRIIFSIGFGKSQRGAVLSNFGDLSTVDANRALANLCVSARKELHLVSCFTEDELAKSESGEAVAMIAQMMGSAGNAAMSQADIEPDAIIEDLTLRLSKLGVTVKSSTDNRLIASFGNQGLIVETCWQLQGDSLSEKLRIRPKLLEALGWGYSRIYAFEIFADPDAVAKSIATRLGVGYSSSINENSWLGENSSSVSNGSTNSNDERLERDRPPHWG